MSEREVPTPLSWIPEGHIVAAAENEHRPFTSPHPGWAEQDPSDWWRAAGIAICEALRKAGVRSSDVVCIGLAGQMHGAVLLDAKNKVLRPALIWCDQRTQSQCDWLNRTIGAGRLIELTCNPALTNFTLTKLLWVRDNEPEVWDRFARILLPKDYVRFCLTGEHAIDVADASGTLMLDVATADGRRNFCRKSASLSRACRACLSRRRFVHMFLQREPPPLAWRRAHRSWRGRETKPPERSAWESSGRAMSAPPLERRASFSQRLTSLQWTRRAACTPFATPSPAAGMSWG